MTGKGWLLLSVLLWLLFSELSDWCYLLAFVGLYFWMKAESGRTGQQPDLRHMIERNIVKGRHSGRRWRRRRY